MENLVKKAKAGDSGAFAQLIRMNTQSMYKVAWAYLKNDEDVADAIQETILKCYEKLSTLKKDSYFKTWMIRILINNCNEMLRHKGRVFPTMEMEEGIFEDDLEAYLGAPENPMMKFFRQQASQPAAKPGEKPAAPRRMGPPKFTPEQQAEIDKYKEEVKAWRLGLDLSKVEGARKLLNEAGISAHIVKMEPSRMGSDEEIDYAFKVAKAMGAKAVTDEINLETAKRVAPFAEKHGMYMAFHNHMQYAEEGFSCDPILAVSPSIMLNFDAGHFFGSTGIHPNEMIKKYHDRIYSIHLKDKTGPTTGDQPNTNQVWGQGEMPLEDVLLLIKQEKWPIYCDIELEYDIKPWSDSVKEVGTCVKYARQILM